MIVVAENDGRVYETNEGASVRLAVAQNRCLFFLFRVYRWHGVAVWKWDVNEDVCGICRLAFDACCPDCTVPGDNCSPGEKKPKAQTLPVSCLLKVVLRS